MTFAHVFWIDGADWQIGYAQQTEDGDFERGIDPLSGLSRIILDQSGLFYSDGVRRLREISTNQAPPTYMSIFGETKRVEKHGEKNQPPAQSIAPLTMVMRYSSKPKKEMKQPWLSTLTSTLKEWH